LKLCLAEVFVELAKLEERAMAQRIDADEGSRGGARTVLTFAIVAAALTVLLVLVGLSGKKVAPETPQPSTESPATSGSQNP
jgi:hypothetical protein